MTKTGNAHARRILIECAWAYRFPARKTATIQRRAERDIGGGASDLLAGAEAVVRALSALASPRRERAENGDGDRTRAVRISMGGRLRGAAAEDVFRLGLSRDGNHRTGGETKTADEENPRVH